MSILVALRSLPDPSFQQIRAYYASQAVPQGIDLFDLRERFTDWIENSLLSDILTFSNDATEIQHRIGQWQSEFVHKISALPALLNASQIALSMNYYISTCPLGHIYSIMRSGISEELRVLHTDFEASMSEVSVKMEQCRLAKDRIAGLNSAQMMESSAQGNFNIPAFYDDLNYKEVLYLYSLIEAAVSSQPPILPVSTWPVETLLHGPQEIMETEAQRRMHSFVDLNTAFTTLSVQIAQELQRVVKRQLEVETQFVNTLEALLKKCQSISDPTRFNESLSRVDRLHKTLDQLIRLLANEGNFPFTFYESGCSELMQASNELLKRLTERSIYIVKEPNLSQIMKKGSKFEVQVKIFGGETLQLKLNPPLVEMILIDEKQAAELINNGKLTQEIMNGCGEVHQAKQNEDTYASSYDDVSSSTCITITDLVIRERPRAPSKLQSVLTNKHYILFHARLGLNGRYCEAWTCSAPFVITTNVSQDVKASATIFWDTYFVQYDPLKVQDHVSMERSLQALSHYMQKETGTKWRLTAENLSYIAFKISHSRKTGGQSDEKIVKKVDFYKLIHERDRNPNHEPLFWNWFLAIIKLIKDHLSTYWEKGYIVGFIDRNKAEEMLPADAGSFILRFPDSSLGGLSASWRHTNGNVYSGVFPIQEKFFPWKSLGNMIRNEATLLNLYHYSPDLNKMILTSKMEAFPLQSTQPPPSQPVYGNGINPEVPRKPYVSSTFTWSVSFEVTNPEAPTEGTDSSVSVRQ